MLLWQLLFTLLYCLICNLFQTVSSNTNNIDEVCFQLAITYGSNNIILQKQSSLLYNKPVWSIPNNPNPQNNIIVAYDQWAKSWEIVLPTTSNTPNVFRVESVTTIPPSALYTHKFTQDKLYITTTCQSNTTSTDPSELTYPKTATSCAEIISYFNHTIPNGIYEITLHNKIYQVYCAFDIENEFAWTLVESFSQFYAATLYSLSFNLGINPKNPIQRDSVYRLPLKPMQSLQSVSTHNLVTCNFDLSMTSDYLLLDNDAVGWNILTKETKTCRPITELNIRGHQCNDGTAPFWTLSNHFHIDSSYDKCQCDAWISTAIKNEDDFGQFRYFNRHHACSASNRSTTNYWIGNKANFPSRFKPTCPEGIEGCSELNLCTTCDDTCEYCQNLNSTTCGPLNCMTCADTTPNDNTNDYALWIIEDDGTGFCWNNNTYKPTCPPEIEYCTPMNSCEECDDTCEYCQHPFKQKCSASDCISCTDTSYHLIPHHKYTYFPFGPHYKDTGYCHHNSTFKPTCPAGIKGCIPSNQCTQCDPSCQYCQSNAWGWLNFDVVMTCNPHECMTCADPNAKFIQLREDGTGYCMNSTQPQVTTTPCPECPDCTTMAPITTGEIDCSKCPAEPCPTDAFITTPEPCDCTGTTATTAAITTKEPCNTETKYIYVNVSCPEPTPCPTLIDDGTTDMPNRGTTKYPTTSTTIIHEDCDYCIEECGMVYPKPTKKPKTDMPTSTPTLKPSVTPTMRPIEGNYSIEPKVSTNHSVRVELRIAYDSVDDLCPTDDSFGDYLLELSTCQALDTDASFCEIVSITTVQTVAGVVSVNNERRLVDNMDEFSIYIAMDIYADTESELDGFKDNINGDSFVYDINYRWNINEPNIAGGVTDIWTEDDITTPSPVVVTTATPTATPVMDNPLGINESVNDGKIDTAPAIGMVIGVSIVLLLCACFCFHCGNKKWKYKSAKEDDVTEGMTDVDNETNEENNNDDDEEISKMSQIHDNQISQRLERVDNGDEAENHVHIDMNVDDEKEIEVNDYNVNNDMDGDDNENNNEQHDFESILQMNGAAYFEDSDLRTQGALPMHIIPNTVTTHGPPIQRTYENITHTFSKQSGPVITQTQSKKYKELLKQQEFLSGLERQLHEIEQQSVNISVNKNNQLSQEPGGSIDTLRTELISLNTNIKLILSGINEELSFDHTEQYNDIDICVQYTRHLNTILTNYGTTIANKLREIDSDEMDIQELEEKRQKYLKKTKRSSKKKTNDDNIMNDMVIKQMKRNSKSYQNEQQKILQNMPSSPSFSNLSNVPVSTPIMQPDILTSNKKRGSHHRIDTDSYENKDDDIIRHNDPPEYTQTHKRDGYVNESTKRMDTYGQLPTPSKSVTSAQYEDSDLKQNMEIINEQRQGLPQPVNYDADTDFRHRGISNVSGTSSNSDVGSLNSADSSDISPIKMIKQKNKKQDVDTGNVNYNANAAFEPSTTNTSQANIINNTTSSGSGSGSGSSGSGSRSNSNGSTEDNDVKDNKKKKRKKKPKKKAKGTGSKKGKFDTSFLKDKPTEKKWKFRGGGGSEKDKKDSPKGKDKKKVKKKKSKKKINT